MRTLQPAVRTLQNTVRLPSQRSTKLSYQDPGEIEKKPSIIDEALWNGYQEYLLQNYIPHTAKVKLSYSKKYCHVLANGNAQELLVLSNDKRIHAMKALATLSKYVGCYDRWKQIRERHQLKWSSGNGLVAFNDIIMNREENYNSMVKGVRDTISKLPAQYGNILLFDTLTGLRPDEACKSIRLLKEKGQESYLNNETMALEHFRFPDVFIRRTKNAYISIMTDKVLELAIQSANCGYNALRLAAKRYGLSMKMGFCRKIFATYLRTNGMEQETIDLLQGRIPRSVFARHYFRPDFDYDKIKGLLDKLYYCVAR